MHHRHAIAFPPSEQLLLLEREAAVLASTVRKAELKQGEGRTRPPPETASQLDDLKLWESQGHFRRGQGSAGGLQNKSEVDRFSRTAARRAGRVSWQAGGCVRCRPDR